MKQKRRNTKLEATGAEFLVLGNLLMRGVAAYKAYVNFPGYDLVAMNTDKKTICRIQVKSRFQTDWDGFIINNFDCDFVVLVALNRGFGKPKKNGETGMGDPDYYVFPVSEVKKFWDKSGGDWGKIQKRHLDDLQLFKGHWKLIIDNLNHS